MSENNSRPRSNRGSRPGSPRPNKPQGRPSGKTRSSSSTRGSSPSSSRPRRSDSTSRPRRDETSSRPRRSDSTSRPRRDNQSPSRDTSRNVRQERKFDIPKALLPIPKDIDLSVVPKTVLAEIRLIAPHTQDLVKQYLAVAITGIESADFDRAYEYAREARNLATRLATVREIAGLAAYYAGKWAEALSEFKTYMRMTGDPHFLPIMADCERGLNRPEKAIALSKNRSVQDLDAAGKIEMRIVVSGARRDLRQFDGALAILEIPELRTGKRSVDVARLRYAYAEALLAMGRKTEARDWFVKASLADVEEETDASERALKLGEI